MPHPLLVVAAAGVAVVAARAIRREMRRIGAEVDRARERAIAEQEGVTLERDPETGVYRARRDH